MSAPEEDPGALRRCRGCRQDRPIDQFYIRKTGTVYTTCKSCENERARIYRGTAS